MINIVLYEPEIPGKTGNIMRTCAGTGTRLHLIKPFGFSLDEKRIKRAGVNYIEHCDYYVYDNYVFHITNTGESITVKVLAVGSKEVYINETQVTTVGQTIVVSAS